MSSFQYRIRHVDWLVWSANSYFQTADFFCHTFIPERELLLYVSMIKTTCTMCVILEWNSFRYDVNTTLKILDIFCLIVHLMLHIFKIVNKSCSFFATCPPAEWVTVKFNKLYLPRSKSTRNWLLDEYNINPCYYFSYSLISPFSFLSAVYMQTYKFVKYSSCVDNWKTSQQLE